MLQFMQANRPSVPALAQAARRHACVAWDKPEIQAQIHGSGRQLAPTSSRKRKSQAMRPSRVGRNVLRPSMLTGCVIQSVACSQV